MLISIRTIIRYWNGSYIPSANIGDTMEFSKHILLRILLPVLTVMISLFIIATTFKVLTHIYTLVNICP